MSGESESSRVRRIRRRPETSETAWDDARTSQADRRRLAEVQEAKRLRRGESVTQLDGVPGSTPGVSAGSTPDATGTAQPQTPRGAESQPPTTTARPDGADASADRVHIDPSLALAPAHEEPRRKIADEVSILVVCTGNVCRSPYFERVLAQELSGLPVVVSGAGTGALLIDRMASGSATLLQARGIDPRGFRPRQLTADMVADADLVLTATREHRHVVVEEAPAQAGKVFALLDFADVCEAFDRNAVPASAGGVEAFRAFVRDAGARTIERRSPRSEEDAAVLDPFRQGQEMFERMARESDPALATVARTVRAFFA